MGIKIILGTLLAGTLAVLLSSAAWAEQGAQERTEVAADEYPYSAVCKLQITYQNGTTGEGTGFIYGDNLLATAAHVLYDTRYARGGGIAQLTILPGLAGEDAPFGTYTVSQEDGAFRYPAQWAQSEDWRYDYGAVVLPQSFDPEAGALELGHYEDYTKQELRRARLAIPGYADGERIQMQALGPPASVRAFDLLYTIRILPGVSGAPVLDENGVVVGIQNYGANTGRAAMDMPFNSGARLVKEAYTFLKSLEETERTAE